MRLFVGNLPWGVNAEALKEFFGSAGQVTDARIIKERSSGRSRGFGFVTFEEREAGLSAIEKFNGAELDGRPLRIDEAIERPTLAEGSSVG
ncbi:MAG: RNA recognition motif domain-containing protein [Bradymonadia bacterium]